MPPISNLDVLFLVKAKQIEDQFQSGDQEASYRGGRELLQDPSLPFYYQGHFHLMLSNDRDDKPIEHALQALKAFDRMMWQSPGDTRVAAYVVHAQKMLGVLVREFEQNLVVEDMKLIQDGKTVSEGRDTVPQEESAHNGEKIRSMNSGSGIVLERLFVRKKHVLGTTQNEGSSSTELFLSKPFLSEDLKFKVVDARTDHS